MMIWHEVEGCTTTLNKLAERYYGDWRMWRYIWDHNEDRLMGLSLYAPLPSGLHLCIPHHPSLMAMVEPPDEQLDQHWLEV